MTYRWTVEELLEQELSCSLETFDAYVGWSAGRAVLRSADSRGLSVTVRVARGQQVLFHAAMEGTSADQDLWLARKINTVNRFGHSSQHVQQLLESYGSATFETFGMDSSDIALSGGAVPILVEGVGMVGVIAVSGLSGEDDHALGVDALRSLKGLPIGEHAQPEGNQGIPTVRSVDHVAYTVPDLEAAVAFFVEYLGGELAFTDGSFSGEYMRTKFNVDPTASCKLAMVRMGTTMNLELFEYHAPEQRTQIPRNSDVGGGHLALYVDDVDAAYRYLSTVPGVVMQEGPNGVAEYRPDTRPTLVLLPHSLGDADGDHQ
jgi:uncharacterized protein (UPF0303 family)/catechol 2,3-dioxygenase-like lactoylglutathione lyase family enzyme